jgi:thiamine pyrophosphokinase
VSKNVIIISNGRFGNNAFFREKVSQLGDCLIICCDGAARHLQESGIKPDIIIGDMDSLGLAQLDNYRKQGIKTIEYPAEKDFTDTELALDQALKLKPAAIYIWGALGGRIDHTLANLFLLIKGKKAKIKTYLLDEYGESFIPENEVIINNAIGCPVSLLALSGKIEGITLKGFAYPLNNGVLSMGETRGLSNYIKESPARISFRSGTLLVIRYWYKDIFPEAL